jgi:hypothetical protein
VGHILPRIINDNGKMVGCRCIFAGDDNVTQNLRLRDNWPRCGVGPA